MRPTNQFKTLSLLLFIAFASIFTGCDNNDYRPPAPPPAPNPEPDKKTAHGVYIGAVGFNDSIFSRAVTDTFSLVKNFISDLDNNHDATALCYGMAQGIQLLTNAQSLASFDYTFLVTFTDGFDNYSGAFFKNVYQKDVVDHTVNLLADARINGNRIKSYTLGLQGDGTLKETDLINLAVNGEYNLASTENLEDTFEKIANNVIDAAKNMAIVTNNVPINQNSPKLFQIEIKAHAPNSSDTNSYYIVGKFFNSSSLPPTFIVSSTSENIAISFEVDDTINGQRAIYGQVNNSKITIPFTNLSLNNGVSELIIDQITVKTRYASTEAWVEDVEDSKAESKVINNIAVVLVLDCSKSIGAEFNNVKNYAINFIDQIVAKWNSQ